MEDLYSAVARMYENDKQKNAAEYMRRHSQVYEKVPRISEIDDIFSKSSIEMAKLALNKTEDLERKKQEYRQKVRELTEEKRSLLLKNGYAEDYLDPIYTCKECLDTGHTNNKKCRCFTRRLVMLNYKYSGAEEILKRENFDTFSYDVYSDKSTGNKPSPRENVRDIVKRLEKPAAAYPEKPLNLIFSGPTGTGKTFLCNCMAKKMLDKGCSLYYSGAYSLLSDLADIHFGKETAADKELILCSDVLVIDDLGAEIPTKITPNLLLFLIEQRGRRGLSTFITTNCGIDRLFENYGERIGSRLVKDYKIFNMYGEDIRFKTM